MKVVYQSFTTGIHCTNIVVMRFPHQVSVKAIPCGRVSPPFNKPGVREEVLS